MNARLIDLVGPALDIAASGWPVFPCYKKVPLTPHGFRDASTDTGTIMDWWMDRPYAIPGVALPAGVIAIDVDDPVAFAATGLDLPSAPEQRTPSGGTHRLYRLREDVKQTVRPFPGVDTRVGGKGYVVAWHPEVFAVRPEDLPPAPEWVYQR